MGNLGFTEAVLLLMVFGVWLPPLAMILKKAGRSPFWVLLGFLPGVNLVALYLFAFTTWPSQQRQG